MSERLGSEAVIAMRRAERHWLEQARVRLREPAVAPGRATAPAGERDEESGR
ncbi:hypothetical protein [Nocardioides ochotonae]|uniref:hypothetical protein n=1 Tax=Nocardioides ochotonae TaxID=2685869 RepID=UPI001409CC74|nr:hypothetical protein [Nocardioides ochotonae]